MQREGYGGEMTLTVLMTKIQKCKDKAPSSFPFSSIER